MEKFLCRADILGFLNKPKKRGRRPVCVFFIQFHFFQRIRELIAWNLVLLQPTNKCCDPFLCEAAFLQIIFIRLLVSFHNTSFFVVLAVQRMEPRALNVLGRGSPPQLTVYHITFLRLKNWKRFLVELALFHVCKNNGKTHRFGQETSSSHHSLT